MTVDRQAEGLRRKPAPATESHLRGRLTAAVHAGQDPGGEAADPHGALSPPIYQSAVYRFADAAEAEAVHEGERPGYVYGRTGTPTQAALERAAAELEGAGAALATASGMAALSLSLLGLLRAGDHLVAARSLYTTTAALLHDFEAARGVEVSRVDGRDPTALERALRPETRAVLVETPANPTLDLVDVAAVAGIARSAGAVTVVDSSFASPFNQRPLDLGADLVVHSASKYLGGHGDLVAGVVCGRRSLVERIRSGPGKMFGPVIAPHTAWLVLRGLRTLGVRMERHNRNALLVARFLEEHPAVAAVHYPGLESHPQHDLARRQMHGFGGVVAFDVGSAEAARRVVDSVRLCSRATSLGDVATLIQHCAGMTQASLPPADRRAAGVSDGLLRLAVGIEDPDDLVADLRQALERVGPAGD